MKNDNSRQWAVLAPTEPGAVLTAQAQQVEAASLAGIFCPQIYSAPFMALGHCAAVTERVQLGQRHRHRPHPQPLRDGDDRDRPRPPVGRSVRARPRNQHADVGGGHLRGAGLRQAARPPPRDRGAHPFDRRSRRHTGELERFEGTYHRHDWSQFQGTFAPTQRPRIPIWIAANQPRLTRLVGEIADGFISHPIHSPRWTLERALPALQEGLRNAGRARADIHWNAWYYMAVNPDRHEALQDARATVAFYAQFEQCEPMFAAHGFEKEARACQDAARRKEYATAGAAAVSDEMAETFVILGSPDECRAKVEELWDVADSFCLIPPLYALPPDKAMFYAAAIADTFYE